MTPLTWPMISVSSELQVIYPEQSQSHLSMYSSLATGSAIEWMRQEQGFYSQRKTFAESIVQNRNNRVIATTSPIWVSHLSPFQIPLSKFTA
jgi:hypothetical protein